ncbi:MAG: ankyrin repeat domain-containing protein [Bacteroidales bacterium]
MKTPKLILLAFVAILTLAACNNKGEKKSVADKIEEKANEVSNKTLDEAFGGDMFKAAREGDLETIKKGLKAGEDINKTNSYGENILMKAAENNHFEVVKYLLDEGADKTQQNIYDYNAAVLTSDDEIRAYIKNYGKENE